MRAAHIAFGVAAVGITATLIAAAGRIAATPVDVVADDGEGIEAPAEKSPSTGFGQDGLAAPDFSGQPPAPPPLASARPVAPETIVRPDVTTTELERIQPRPPLSELALAAPPKVPEPGDLKGEPLFRPIAIAAGRMEAGGYIIAISGLDIVEPDETCTDARGKSWSCGAAARTAFRAFLRGRALQCTSSDKVDGKSITTTCSVGRQDIWSMAGGKRLGPGAAGRTLCRCRREGAKDGQGHFWSCPRSFRPGAATSAGRGTTGGFVHPGSVGHRGYAASSPARARSMSVQVSLVP